MFGQDHSDNNIPVATDDSGSQVTTVPVMTDEGTDQQQDQPQPDQVLEHDENLTLPEPVQEEQPEVQSEQQSEQEFAEEPQVQPTEEDDSNETNEQSFEAPAEEAPAQDWSQESQDETPAGNTSGDLSSLKSEALQALSPLIGHLDQSEEERYETAKMVYDETKDSGVLKAVYEAAKNLPDEKAKAAAIYDVIQKINQLS